MLLRSGSAFFFMFGPPSVWNARGRQGPRARTLRGSHARRCLHESHRSVLVDIEEDGVEDLLGVLERELAAVREEQPMPAVGFTVAPPNVARDPAERRHVGRLVGHREDPEAVAGFRGGAVLREAVVELVALLHAGE